ncbi:hypothetical protein SFA35_24335 [Pseudomonas sp. HR96]|uniref:hypothetical protein n=1 Tax=Pseudomonas sp. HR96 TaxID=1027966 RepID=UPI002A754600|nr:hypothetical protein [Pseudomonas sp. HR96]WPO99686.1 hypothetical protein SFA35_24335 [Pseudomonas sp. HR96]
MTERTYLTAAEMLSANLTGTVALLLTVGLLISMCLTLYIAFFKLDQVLDRMSKALLRARRCPFPNGAMGRIRVIGELMGLAAFPSVAINNGSATAEEIQSIPVGMRSLLKRMFWGNVGLLGAGAALWLAYKLEAV